MIMNKQVLENAIDASYKEIQYLEEKIKAQEFLQKQTEKTAHIGSWEIDATSNQVLWSDETYAIFDKKKESISLSYETLLSSIHFEDREMVNSEYLQSIIDKREFYVTHRIVHNDNTIVYVEERGVHSYDSSGKIKKTVGVVLDITQRSELEAKLLEINIGLDKQIEDEVEKNRLQEIQLLQQSRLAQMGEMISMIAHQWRQPLHAISTTAASMKFTIELEEYNCATQEGKEEQQEYFLHKLDSIEEYIQNLTTTVDDFRNFYKPNKKEKKLLLEEVCEKALKIIRASLKADGIELVYAYNSQEMLTMFDGEMMQVLLNLFKNAQDNFKEQTIKSPWIKIITHKNTIKICDNGGGIPETIMEKIFDPYFSTKNEKNGTGLGLYMSKTIIEEHHYGKIYAQNTNDGVCFIIELQEEVN